MSDLVEFLRARLDEDEWIAKGAARDHGVRWEAGATFPLHGSDSTDDHIARHDPARVLAEVDAERRIIDEHHPVDPCDAHDASFQTVECDTLRLLALPYADHPDYREEWRP